MTDLGSAESSRSVSISDPGCIWHFRFHLPLGDLVPQKTTYAYRASPVSKAPCCNEFKCTSNSNKHRNLSSQWHRGWRYRNFEILVLAFQPRTTMGTAVGKSWQVCEPKLERTKHIRRPHEQFPYLMAALEMRASCIVQSITKAAQKHQKTRVAPWFTNSARCLHLSPLAFWVFVMSHVFMLNLYCKLQMELNNVLLCCLPLSIA